MKKILMLSVAALALSSASFASTVIASCGNVQYNGSQQLTSASNTVSCPSFSLVVAPATIGALPGQVTYTSTTLLYLMDNTQNIGGTYSDTLSFTTSPALVPATVSFTGNQNQFSYGDPGSGAANATGPTPFSTTVTGGFNVTTNAPVLVSGSVLGSSYAFAVSYDYTVNPSGVPEPSTVALIGAGLVGLASLARRRRS